MKKNNKINKISAVEAEIYEIIDYLKLTADERANLENLVDKLVQIGLDIN